MFQLGDLLPDREGLVSIIMEFSGGFLMALKVREVGDRFMDGQKWLSLSGRLEPLHDPFSGRKVRILGSVVQTLVLPVLDIWHELSFRSALDIPDPT